MRLFRALAVVCVAGWLGIMAFFSFEVAPIVFKTIDRAIAGQAVTAVLPRYYQWGLTLSAIALAASAIQVIWGTEGRLRPLLATALCGLMVTMLVWASTVLMPPGPRSWSSTASAGGGAVADELQERPDAIGHRRRRLLSDRLARGEQKPGECLRVDVDAAPGSFQHPLNDLLKPQTHLLARPCQREGGGLVGATRYPGAEDLAGQRRRRPIRRGELLESRGERLASAAITRELGNLLREREQAQLGWSRAGDTDLFGDSGRWSNPDLLRNTDLPWPPRRPDGLALWSARASTTHRRRR